MRDMKRKLLKELPIDTLFMAVGMFAGLLIKSF